MNPLIFFIVVVILDVFLKSAKDKKKIEEARRKRTRQIQDRTSKGRNIMDTFNNEIEKNLRRRVPREPSKDMNKSRELKKDSIDLREYKLGIETLDAREYSFGNSFEESRILEDDKSKIKEKELKKTSDKNSTHDLSKDILRGIIFSEILSEPKSIQNMKRSM